MGQRTNPPSVLLILAAFSRYDEALRWGRERAEQGWGPVALASPVFAFDQTDYYEPSMGAGLKKCFWAFERLVDPGQLVEVKLQTNEWEAEYAALGRHPEPRPINLDPGYITPAKLVLASKKDFAHRIYLSLGIYAEATLSYRHRRWQAHEWTFPDYRQVEYHEFFTKCREYLAGRLAVLPAASREGDRPRPVREDHKQ